MFILLSMVPMRAVKNNKAQFLGGGGLCSNGAGCYRMSADHLFLSQTSPSLITTGFKTAR